MSSISIALFALLIFALEWLVVRAPGWLRQRARRSVLPLALVFAVLALPGCELLPPSPAPSPLADLSQAQGEAVAAIALAALRTDESPRPEPLPPAPPPPPDDFGQRPQAPSVLPPAPVETPLPEPVAYPDYADPAAANCGPHGCGPPRRGFFSRWRARRR